MTKHYEIKDYAHAPDSVSYVNQDTISVFDAWTTVLTLDPIKLKNLKQTPTPPKQFKTKTEAKEFLDALKSSRLKDWEDNKHMYKLLGFSKPQWKIYCVETES